MKDAITAIVVVFTCMFVWVGGWNYYPAQNSYYYPGSYGSYYPQHYYPQQYYPSYGYSYPYGYGTHAYSIAAPGYAYSGVYGGYGYGGYPGWGGWW